MSQLSWFAPRLSGAGNQRSWIALAQGSFLLGVATFSLWLALLAPAHRTAPPPAVADPVPAVAPAEEQSPAAPPEARDDTVPPAWAAGLRPPPHASEPPWLRFAAAEPPSAGRPRIAIVIDDLGVDRPRTERAIGLKAPVTLSFMAYAGDLPRFAEEAHRAGHELLLHVPMEPMSPAEDMGPNGLATGLSRGELLRRLRWDLSRFDGYVGINNHMGSRFTSDAASMMPVLEELKARGLLFLDSRTAATTTGSGLAQKLGVPNAERDVFLDDEVDARAIDAQLKELEAVARKNRTAIAIGHPHDATIERLAHWIDSLPAKGLVLVPVSAVVRAHQHAAGEG